MNQKGCTLVLTMTSAASGEPETPTKRVSLFLKNKE